MIEVRPARQNGIVVVTTAILLAAVTGLIVLGIQADIKRLLLLYGDSASVRVSRAADEIRAWYERNAWEIERNPGILSTSGITTEDVVLASSRQLEKDGIRYHVLAVWIPAPGVTGTRLDPETGIFHPGTTASGAPARVHHAVISGYPIQATRALASRRRVQKIASGIENWASVRQSHDPDGGYEKNWLRRADCGRDDGAIPCYDAFTPIEHTTTGALVGISPLDFRNAWGQPVYIRNAQASLYPYRLILRTDTPWGQNYIVEAIQR